MSWSEHYADILPEGAIPLYGWRLVRYLDANGEGEFSWIRDCDDEAVFKASDWLGDLELTKLQFVARVGLLDRWSNQESD